MGKKISAIKGMEDLYEPQAMRVWQLVESIAGKVFEKAGFQEIRTPIVEYADLFERSVGETTEIVEKEMYTLLDRNGKRLALRPEGTASVVRAFIDHFTNHNILEARFFYFGPMFRYERPQKGRYRQFHQIAAEHFGTDHPLADAEMIGLAHQLFSELKLENVELHLNSLGSREDRKTYIKELKNFLGKVSQKLCEDCQRRIERNPLRALDCKKPACMEWTQGAPSILDSLSKDSVSHFDQVQKALDGFGIRYVVNPRMVRGLDYYEKTVFEFLSGDLGAQNAFAAGGRYNDLVSDLGGPSVPAVGFALGMERLISIIPLEKHREEKIPRIYLVGLDAEGERELFLKMQGLREGGAIAQLDLGGASLKSKMRRASRWQADWVVLRGEEERKKGIMLLRNMAGSSQEEISEGEILLKLLGKIPCQKSLG